MSRKKIIIPEVHNFKYGKLEQDNVFVGGELKSVAETTGYETGKGLDQFLIVQNKIVNVVSGQYGWMPNEVFFGTIEQRLNDAGLHFAKRSINRNNVQFAVDYILQDDNFHINVKKGKDVIKPMIRAINAYDGTSDIRGHFGFFREICSNGNHVSDLQVSFKQRRRGNVMEIVMPKIEDLVAAFMDNEFYSLHEKFEVLAESPISNVEEFVKYTLGKTGLFKYAKSEKNPDELSIGAQYIIKTITAEAAELKTKPNLWLGYNAFNEYIHTANEKVFKDQEKADKVVFNTVMAMAN